jgi:hypothetical protein
MVHMTAMINPEMGTALRALPLLLQIDLARRFSSGLVRLPSQWRARNRGQMMAL